ncbi:MAG TPA: hypothetical protein VGD56_00985 [Gemmatirosa sp.]
MAAAPSAWYRRHVPQKLAGAVVAIALWLFVRALEPARAYVPVRVYGRTAPAYAAAGGVYALVDGSAGVLALLAVRPPVLRARAASSAPGTAMLRPDDVILPRGLARLSVRGVTVGDRP